MKGFLIPWGNSILATGGCAAALRTIHRKLERSEQTGQLRLQLTTSGQRK
jgi:hypothetical protein